MIGSALDWLSKALLVLAAMLAFMLAFVVVVDVGGRVFFNSPLKGTPELVSGSIVVICYLQAAYAILSGGMLHVEVLAARLPVRMHALLGVLTSLLGVLLFGVIAWGSVDGLHHAVVSGEYEGEGALRVPMWPVRLAVLVGSVLAAVAYVVLALRHVDAARRDMTLVSGASH
jgi:TRAP-type C4-dicarboxylate transport system permease small subunit